MILIVGFLDCWLASPEDRITCVGSVHVCRWQKDSSQGLDIPENANIHHAVGGESCLVCSQNGERRRCAAEASGSSRWWERCSCRDFRPTGSCRARGRKG